MHDDAIETYMTGSVHTIGARKTLEEAHHLMRTRKVRHLPVLKGGKLVGIVSQRDLALIESLPGVDPEKVTVEDAMSDDLLVVTQDTLLAEVAQKMARRKVGSAVVTDGGQVVGIFTAVDALKTLDFFLTSPPIRRGLHEALVPTGAATRQS